MAGLTERLPLTSETNRVLDDPAGPNLLGTVAAFASDTLQGYMQIRQGEAEKRTARAKEEEKRRRTDATLATLKMPDLAAGDVINSQSAPTESVADTVPTVAPINENVSPDAAAVFGGTGVNEITVDPSLTSAVKRAGNEINNVKAAVDQGRMPSISLKAAISGRFNSLIEQYPDQAEHILDLLKKMGVDTALFRAGKDLGDQLDEDREAGQRQVEDNRQFEQSMFEIGAKAAGDLLATGGSNGGAMSREEVIAHGLKVSRSAHDFELANRQATLALSNANLSKETRTQVESDRNTYVSNFMENAVFNGTAPAIKMVQNLASSLMKEGDPTTRALKWQEMGTRLHQMFGNQVENAIQSAIGPGGGYTGDTNTLRTKLWAKFKTVEDLFTGEFSVAQTHIQALGTVQAALKLDADEALPVYSAMRSLGMDPATMVGFTEGIAKNPALQEKLRNEIKGFTADFGRDRASDHMINIIKMFRGEQTLAYMSPSEARGRMPELYNVSEEISKRYARGLGGNPDMVMNGLGEIAIAVNTLAPVSGADAHHVGVEGILGGDQVQALKRLSNDGGVDKAMATATIQAARAGGAHVLNNMQTVLPKLNQNPYYKIVWDNRNGKYVLDDSGKRKALATLKQRTPNLRGVGAGLETGAANFSRIHGMDEPKEMKSWRMSANIALDGIMALKTEDPSTPAGSDLELRNYYGRNIAPKSLQGGGDGTGIDLNKNVDTQFDAITKVIDENLTKGLKQMAPPTKPESLQPPKSGGPGARSVIGTRGQKVEVPAVEEIHKTYANNPNYRAVQAAADRFEIPKDIATRLIYVESRFDNQASPNSAGAQGPAQVVGRIHDEASKKIFGKPIAQLTPEENIQYGLAYLRKLYEQHGSWNEAIQRYLGKGKKGDGNLVSSQYAELIE